MKAAELIQLEPFGEVLEATIAGFLPQRFGGEWQVRWRTGSETIELGAQRWLANLNINALFVPNVRPETLDIVRREFASSPVPWKRPLHRAYFRAAASGWFSRYLAGGWLDIQPHVPNAERQLIVPGMSKIRFIDTQHKLVYCCRKTNATVSRFAHELDARRQAEQVGVTVPQITGALSDDCIVEQMVAGTPLNRLPRVVDREISWGCALATIGRLYSATRKLETSGDYMRGVAAAITGRLRECECLAAVAPLVTSVLDEIVQTLVRYGDEPVPTVQSHGDFQPANLLWDGSQTWLIDWEFSTRRQERYDQLVFELGSRWPSGLAQRMKVFVQKHSTEDRNVVACLWRFVAEELAFRCEEAASTPRRSMPPAFEELLREIPSVLTVLNEENHAPKSQAAVV